jgi:nicotinate-nucleotide pyrophosphorylase (carboxylating)
MAAHPVDSFLSGGRRAWTIEEKVAVLDYLKANSGNKKRTARELGIPCTKMLRDWVQSESDIRHRVTRLSGSKRISKRTHVAASTLRTRLQSVGLASDALRAGNEQLNFRDGIIHDSSFDRQHPEAWNECLCAPVSNASRHGVSRSGHNESQSAETRNDSVSSAGATLVNSSIMDIVPTAGLAKMVDHWLEEDCSGFDYGAGVVGSGNATAFLFAKSTGIVAGRVFFDAVFNRLGCEVTWSLAYQEGSVVDPTAFPRRRIKVAVVTGPVRLILQGERIALNALAECSGIATAAARFVAIAKAAHWNGVLAGTRKTTPGFRLVQKYGMLIGGMDTHRMDLSSMIMLKDNHIAAAGSIRAAVVAARAIGGFSLKIDVECSTLAQAIEAADAGGDIVMLDNFDPAVFRETATTLRVRYPGLIIEGSGGLSEATISQFFCNAADVLSFSINRYAAPMDFSLKIQ